jgi:hypothetical protein
MTSQPTLPPKSANSSVSGSSVSSGSHAVMNGSQLCGQPGGIESGTQLCGQLPGVHSGLQSPAPDAGSSESSYCSPGSGGSPGVCENFRRARQP